MTVSGTPGTGDITLLAAVSGHLTLANAGVANGDVVPYAAKDGANWEIGTATYNTTGPKLTGRTITKSTNSNAAVSLTSAAEVFITPRAEDLLSITETQTANRVFAGPSSGGAAAPAFRALVAADLPATGLQSIVYYTSTQTITIPTGATKAKVRLWGGTGGGGGAKTAASNAGAGGGAGGLEKYLTGLTAGNTLALTVGAAGAGGSTTPGNGTAGGNSTLASGTQTITTLTANGGGLGQLASGGTTNTAGGAGGTATNGDINVTGQKGEVGNDAGSIGGVTGLGMGVGGGGASATSTTGVAGSAGLAGGCIIEWYA
jgi:hypothetical protein